jgi:diaminopropionate ammonia-lyase family
MTDEERNRTMLHANPRAIRAAYPSALRAILNIETALASRRILSHWDGIRMDTPVWNLPGLARSLGVGAVHVKDESTRSPLGSFKALGAPLALVRLLQRSRPGLAAPDLFAGRHARDIADFTVISATDGNHGRALAAAARSIGCRCVIVLHANVSVEREEPIAAYGAQIVRIAGNYDDSVREAASLAARNGWHVVSDTSYDGYEEIPRDVMQGYAVIADEVFGGAAAAGECPYTHVFLQGGVGGLAAGVVSYLWERYGARRPAIVIVEPGQADCLLQSAIAGRPAPAKGSVDSVMAGLACGEPSPLAWRFLDPAVDGFMTVSDAQAVDAMRMLATGTDGDAPVLAGESGAAGLAGLAVLRADEIAARPLGIDGGSRVLLVNTEGATAPQLYEDLTGMAPQSVLERQAQWRRASSAGAGQ